MASKHIRDEETRQIADLIKIRIPQQQLSKYTSQLNTVLDAVEVLKELETKKVGTTSQTHGLKNILREDEPTEGLDMSKYQNKQNFQDGYFVVSKVI
jgi:aspartyl-tRNA(Asn)/glutamyl-tRNA(Gln) amidotransferase subunit C